jgi:hypothetical protein
LRHQLGTDSGWRLAEYTKRAGPDGHVRVHPENDDLTDSNGMVGLCGKTINLYPAIFDGADRQRARFKGTDSPKPNIKSHAVCINTSRATLKSGDFGLRNGRTRFLHSP